jgi:4-hydroxymandelate oxidase
MNRRAMLKATATIAATQLLSTSVMGQRVAKPAIPVPVSLTDFEPLARSRMTHMAWEYINGGTGDEITMRSNREAYDRMKLMPTALVDVSHIDTSVELLGQRLTHPILLAPTAYHRLFNAEGELATAKGAGEANAIYVVSTMATTAVEGIAKVATKPLWFQLYVNKDRGFTRALVERAEAAGCKAIVVTVDTPVLGTRYREMRLKFDLPKGVDRVHLRALNLSGAPTLPAGTIYSPLFDANLTWKDIEWLRSFAKVPVLLKGILNADDAELAVKAGASGIAVSNHGGRNLDTVPATIEVLPRIAEKVDGKVPLLVDGGIRRGTDVLKALALGARAVMIGRPYLYGLSVAGAAGVAQVVEILRREFEMAMALTGRRSVGDIGKSVLYRD